MSSLPLSRHNDGLPHTLFPHCRIRILRNSEQIWFQLVPAPPSSAMCLDDFGSIQSRKGLTAVSKIPVYVYGFMNDKNALGRE